MAGWLRRLMGWPLRRRRREMEALLDTDPGVSDTAVLPQIAVGAPGSCWAVGGTDRGLVRENNEDDYLCSPDRRLFIVCDGMGGHAAGEVASSEAIDMLDEVLMDGALAAAVAAGERQVEDLFRAALQRANDRIVDLGQRNSAWSGMASAVVVCTLSDCTLYVANLGDCRAYRISKGRAMLLTVDHSVAAALMAQGQLTPEEARAHPLRNHLTASLGLPQPVRPAFSAASVEPGDRVLLCSDGLWDMLSDARIAEMANTGASPEETVQQLIAAANAAGGEDNITVILVKIGEEETAPERQPGTETVAAVSERTTLSSACQPADGEAPMERTGDA